MSVQSPYVLPVGDPRRFLIGRVAFGTLVTSAIFVVFTMTKQVKPVYLHAPWVNDPYDTVLSFTMFFVPLVAATCLVPVSLCRKSEPLSAGRVVTILRGCQVAVGGIVLELLAAWAAVILRANRPEWTVATAILIALLILLSTVTAKVIVDVVRAPRLPRCDHPAHTQEPDWLGDLVIVARRQSHRLGPFRLLGLRAIAWADRGILTKVRRHPLGAAAATSGAFGATAFGWQAIREGYSLSVTALEIGLGFCGMFAFLVLAGSYLSIARAPSRLYGGQRRAVDAGVVACIVAIAALAFRDSLWWIVGSDAAAAGPSQFAALLGIATFIAFVLVFAVETLRGSHSQLIDKPLGS